MFLSNDMFSVFVNDLTASSQITKMHLYADDARIYFSRPLSLIENLVERINGDLLSVGLIKTIYDLIQLKPKLLLYRTVVTLPPRVLMADTDINHLTVRIRNILGKLWLSSHYLYSETKLTLL